MEKKNCNKLKELEPYIDKLSFWSLVDKAEMGNPDTQCADYIITYDNNDHSTSIHTIRQYCDHLLSSTNVIWNTFSWTYPSKRGKENIQLKCKILKIIMG